MSDIVDRLRDAIRCLDRHVCAECDRCVHNDKGCDCTCHDCPWDDAADEIDRLRAALHLAAGLLSSLPPYDHMHPEQVLTFLMSEDAHRQRIGGAE